MSEPFTYSEALYAQKVGLTRDEITQLRKKHLRPEVDWKKRGGHEIALTQDAIVKLCRVMRNRPSELELSACAFVPEKKPGAALRLTDRISATNPIEMTVLKIWGNPRVLYAMDEQGEEHHVIVEKNSNFVVGMKLPAMPDPRNRGFMVLVGPLPPRKGRWY